MNTAHDILDSIIRMNSREMRIRNVPHPGEIAEQILKTRFPDKNITELASLLKIGRVALSNFFNLKAGISIELAKKIELLVGYEARALLIAQIDYDLDVFEERVFLKSRGQI